MQYWINHKPSNTYRTYVGKDVTRAIYVVTDAKGRDCAATVIPSVPRNKVQCRSNVELKPLTLES